MQKKQKQMKYTNYAQLAKQIKYANKGTMINMQNKQQPPHFSTWQKAIVVTLRGFWRARERASEFARWRADAEVGVGGACAYMRACALMSRPPRALARAMSHLLQLAMQLPPLLVVSSPGPRP